MGEAFMNAVLVLLYPRANIICLPDIKRAVAFIRNDI